jgi:hypothetical protein
MGETLLNRIIEDFVVAVHRKFPDTEEVLETADQVFALATRLDWIDEIAAEVESLKWRLAKGWERSFWEASTKAKRLALSGDAAGAARALRDVVREIATKSSWYPLAFFDFKDVVDLETLKKYLLDKKRLAERCPHLDRRRLDEARAYALRIFDRLDKPIESGARGDERRSEASTKGEPMNMTELKKKAIGMGIQPGKKRRHEIILEIQIAEGNAPCYGTNDGTCRHEDCCWLDDCAEQRERLKR